MVYFGDHQCHALLLMISTTYGSNNFLIMVSLMVKKSIQRSASFILVSILIFLSISAWRALPDDNVEPCHCPTSELQDQKKLKSLDFPDSHHLCILVPFRDRFDELLNFVPYMSDFLSAQKISFSIYVVNQVDPYRFNRAALFNTGFTYVEKTGKCDYLALHDVDLLPANKKLLYNFPEDGPLHLSPPGLHPKYDYPNFIGGIMLITTEHFKSVNGMSNRFWGWGLEDDEFFARLQEADLELQRPQNIETGTSNTFKHWHSPRKRKRDYQKCYNQRDMQRRRDWDGGLDTLDFEMKKVSNLNVDGHPVTILNVWLNCDKNKTPWCDCSDAPKKESPLKPLNKEDNIMPYLPKKHKKRKT